MTLAKTQRSPRAEIQFQELGFSGIPNIKKNVEICIPPLAIFASWREIFLVQQHVTTNIIDIPQPIPCPAQPLGAQLTFDELEGPAAAASPSIAFAASTFGVTSM
jgi:hypothetical protein